MESSAHHYKQPAVLFDPIRNALVTSDTFNQFSSLPLSLAISNSIRRLRLSRNSSQKESQRPPNANLSKSTGRKRRNTVDNSVPVTSEQIALVHTHHVKDNNGGLGSEIQRKYSVSNDHPIVTNAKPNKNVGRSMSMCVRRPTIKRRETLRLPLKLKYVQNSISHF